MPEVSIQNGFSGCTSKASSLAVQLSNSRCALNALQSPVDLTWELLIQPPCVKLYYPFICYGIISASLISR